MNIGDRVRIERDETRYPSKGCWPQFRGKRGTVVEVNTDTKRPHLTEYAVCFGKVTPMADPVKAKREFWWDPKQTYWFKRYEISTLAAQRVDSSPNALPEGNHTREALAHV